MQTDRQIVISTYRFKPVTERERVSTIFGHPLNQLQVRALARHDQRLNYIVAIYQSVCKFRITFLDGSQLDTNVRQGEPCPVLLYGKLRLKPLDTYKVYNILPLDSKGNVFAPDSYPFKPRELEFRYLQDLTDYRQLR